MRRIVFLLAPGLLWAQSASTSYQTDVNGRRQAVGSREATASGGATTLTRSVDGRQVPLESSTEKELRKDATTRVVERTIQRYDPNGRPSGVEKVLIEEKTLPNGGKVVTETASRSELNGNFRPTQRTVTETRVSGNTTTTSVTLDRPNVNGGFVTEEKRNTVAVGSQGNTQSTETVERPDTSGRFRTVGRSETATQTKGGETTANTSTYTLDATGRVSLLSQQVERTTKRPDGSSVTETTLYKANVAASVQGPNAKLLPAEQKVLERRVGSDGRVTEALSVRRASGADPGRLEAPTLVSETVCSGKCLPADAAGDSKAGDSKGAQAPAAAKPAAPTATTAAKN